MISLTIEQEGDVCLDSPDMILPQSTTHSADGTVPSFMASGVLD